MENVAKKLVNVLQKQGLTLASAESCTGGMIASKIVDISGASEVFQGGFVTYSNEMKKCLLDVKAETLEQHGAVSEETALEMVKGAASKGKSACAISTTGIAGPLGGTKEKPVGLVYIGTFVNGKTLVKKWNFEGDRECIRNSAANAGLQQLYEMISKEESGGDKIQ